MTDISFLLLRELVKLLRKYNRESWNPAWSKWIQWDNREDSPAFELSLATDTLLDKIDKLETFHVPTLYELSKAAYVLHHLEGGPEPERKVAAFLLNLKSVLMQELPQGINPPSKEDSMESLLRDSKSWIEALMSEVDDLDEDDASQLDELLKDIDEVVS